MGDEENRTERNEREACIVALEQEIVDLQVDLHTSHAIIERMRQPPQPPPMPQNGTILGRL